MAKRCLLHLDSARLSLWRWQRAALREEGSFAVDAAGVAGFAAYLAQHPEASFALLVNVAEEAWQRETIPFLRGADRVTVIRRKLRQQFGDAALTSFLSLGHARGQRREERLLLAALTHPEGLAPWLTVVRQAGVALSGVYAQALLGGTLLRRLRLAGESCLLLSVHAGSVRQSYFDQGGLRFSRLSSLADGSRAGLASALAHEARQVQQYLRGQRLVAAEQPLTVRLLAHADSRQAIAACCVDDELLRFSFIDIEDAARRCGLKTPPGDDRCDALFLHLLATDPPPVQFADETLRQPYRLRRIRQGIVAVGAATLALCLLLAGQQWFASEALLRQEAALATEAEAARQRYRSIVSAFPPLPADKETLLLFGRRHAELAAQGSAPQTLLFRLSRLLDAAPQIELEAIDWESASASASTSATASGDGRVSLAGEVDGALLRGRVRDGGEVHASGVPASGVAGTTRRTLAAFDAFLAAIEAEPELRLEVRQAPFAAGEALRSDDGAIDRLQEARFVIAVGRREIR
ncbi:hypothetical protein [Rhodocyclus purpureus]|uniref:hypothetical protein n=1 Tax=Rhodocyclus purpureus TaxID=1067 RepID=UPI001912A936|nr:hypothetical protein [Rhodocyclus purpureus]MBK5913495.1 hypothetical protein [Rhodocyclus purpureus]